MKKHIILIITLFTINFANGQLPLNYIFSNRDDVSYKGADSGIKAYPWNSGILYLGFCYDSLDIKEGFCITFYDILGTKIWSKTYFSDEYIMYQAEDIIALNNYSFYIGGTVYKDTTCQEDRMFAKFDANGDTIYTKIYHDVEQNWVMSLDTFSSDTILMLSAKTPNNPYPYTKTVICKIDTLGNIVKTHEGPYNLNIPRKILRGPGYFIYVGGTLSTSTTSQYNVKAYYEMYYLDLSNYSLFYPSTTTNEYFAGMFLKDGLLYLARDVTTYDPQNQHPFYICRLSYYTQMGSLINSNDFGPMNFDGATGNFLCIDSTKLMVQIYSTLYFVDNNLNLICESNDIIGQSNNIYGFGWFTLLPNKMIAGTGGYLPDTNHSQDHWNFLTQNILNYLISDTLGIKENTSNNNISIYPNPSKDNLTIETNSNTNQSIEIINIVGQTIYTSTFSKKTTIDVSRFPKGVYILKIINKDKESIVKKFIKE